MINSERKYKIKQHKNISINYYRWRYLPNLKHCVIETMAYTKNLQMLNHHNTLVLDIDKKSGTEIVVDSKIVSQLKPHQKEGLQFLFKSCYNDLNESNVNDEMVHGCILAHCMGLGKTFQVIALLHTVIHYPQLKTERILVLCPKSTILNWQAEVDKWLGPIKSTKTLKVFNFPHSS